MQETPKSESEKLSPSIKEVDLPVDEASMNKKFQEIHDKSAIRKELEEYDAVCDNADKDDLAECLVVSLNRISFLSRGSDRAKNSESLNKNKTALDVERKKFEIAKDAYIRRFFQAANGSGLANKNSLVNRIQNDLRGQPFDEEMQAFVDDGGDLSREFRQRKAVLRAVDEESLGLEDESTEALYQKIEEGGDISLQRLRNIIMDVLSAREGFDAIPSAELKIRIPKMKSAQQKVATYVIEVLRDSKRSW